MRRNQPAYPPLLAAIHDPPAQLYVRGSTRGLPPGPTVAIVGARACSAYGAHHVARQLGCELARAGVVVSGLARGIDGEAHRGALTGGGPTAAVLGGGLDRIYPSAHTKLSHQIAQQGALVSEYALGTVPAPWRFPARNRIVAGLSQAVVVVEAGAKSGALITADLALEEGREVLAVPGEITSSLSAGTNALLQQGAAPLTCPQDVLGLLGLDRPQAAEPPALLPLESSAPGGARCTAAGRGRAVPTSRPTDRGGGRSPRRAGARRPRPRGKRDLSRQPLGLSSRERRSRREHCGTAS